MQDVLLISGLVGVMGLAVLEKLLEIHGLRNSTSVLKALLPIGAVAAFAVIIGEIL